jgi:hypothetical protein
MKIKGGSSLKSSSRTGGSDVGVGFGGLVARLCWITCFEIVQDTTVVAKILHKPQKNTFILDRY